MLMEARGAEAGDLYGTIARSRRTLMSGNSIYTAWPLKAVRMTEETVE